MTSEALPAAHILQRDGLRQWLVLLCFLAAIAGSLIGSGAFGGTAIADAAGGALSADATFIAPAVPAFSIWSIIYLGLGAYTIWQLLGSQKHDLRQRRLGYPIAASLVLNAAWILSVQAGLLALSAVVIVLLVAVLAYAFRICILHRGTGWQEAVVVDGVVGLYLGWVCVATAANIASVLTAGGFTGWGLSANGWAVAIVTVAGLIGVGLAVAGRGRLAPALALCWGLAWVAVARLSGSPSSVPTAVAALSAVLAVLAVTVVSRVMNGNRAAA